MIRRDVFLNKQLVFVFALEGDRISFANDNVVIKDCDGKVKLQTTCYRIYCIFIVGHLSITTPFIMKCKNFGINLVLMTQNMKVYNVFGFEAEGNVLLREKQYGLKEEESFEIAKWLVSNKISNQRLNLCLQRNKSEKTKRAIEALAYEIGRISEASNVSQLMGIEGNSAKMYFSSHFANCVWQKRAPRVKADYINATLDIAYTILFNYIEALLRLFGFDLYKGNLHQFFYMRKSLVCDLVEPFRPLMDQTVKKAISLGQCKEKDFGIKNGSFFLLSEKNKSYVSFLSAPLIQRKEDIYIFVHAFYKALVKGDSIEKFPVFK